MSCSSIQIFSDHDSSVDFSGYKTFAYFKTEIDQVNISDLDKRRILKALDYQMSSKGLSKSERSEQFTEIKEASKATLNEEVVLEKILARGAKGKIILKP